MKEGTVRISEETVDAFVDSIIVRKDYFEWNLNIAEEPFCCNVDGNKSNAEFSLLNNPTMVMYSTS
jgi:hypothetical protein